MMQCSISMEVVVTFYIQDMHFVNKIIIDDCGDFVLSKASISAHDIICLITFLKEVNI